MSFFADEDNITFGVQGSNEVEVAQFSSTLDDVFLRLFTNNNSFDQDNVVTGSVIGSSNYDKTADALNELYLGHVVNSNEVQKIVVIREDKVGINTAPTAPLHVWGSNQDTWDDLVRVEVKDGAQAEVPALVVDKTGFVGIGVSPTNTSTLTVNGYTFSDAMHTPFMVASNIIQTFHNVSTYKFLDHADATAGTPNPRGDVPLTSDFYGNSTDYTYTLTITSNNGFNVTTNPVTIQNTSSHLQLVNIDTPGNYDVNIAANTSGFGAGSSYTSNHVAHFTVNEVDQIGAPTVTSTTMSLSTANVVSISGIPYYGSGTVLTFPIHGLAFTNIYNIMDPRLIASNVLTLTDGYNSSNYTHNQVFTNVLSFSASNTRAVHYTLSNALTTSTVSVSGITSNVNYTEGDATFLLVPQIAYVGASIDEVHLPITTFSPLPVTSITRMSVSSSAVGPLTPDTSTELTLYTNGASPSANDTYYSPYTPIRYYVNPSAIPRGTFAPAFTPVAGNHNHLVFKVNATAPLTNFVLRLTDSYFINRIRIKWESVSGWYDPTVLYTNAGGCAASTYTSGMRYPIALPLSASLTSTTPIYISIELFTNGYVERDGILLSYT
jgi:hypothetical protein